jgi:PAS domain S-box-containing protein
MSDPSESDPIRVLAIDDHQHILDFVQDICTREGFAYVGERSAVDALIRLRRDHDFDVVLLDVMMPGMDGFAFLQKLQAQQSTAGLHVLMLTAVSDPTAQQRAFAAGAADYLVKPFSPQDFVARVRTHARLSRVERALAESGYQYQLLAENSVDVIWQIDLNFNFQYINPAVENLLGYQVEEWIGTNLQQHCTDTAFAHIRRMLGQVLEQSQTNPTVEFETELLHKEGWPVPVEIRGRIIFDEQGAPICIQGNTRDISLRQAQEQANRRLAAVIDQAHEIVLIVDLQSHLIYSNPQIEPVFGFKAQELIGKAVRYLEQDTPQSGFFTRLWQTIQGRTSWSGRGISKHRDGHYFPVAGTVFPLRDQGGAITHYAAIIRDISAQVKSEEALNRSLKTYSALFEQSQDGIMLLDLDGRNQAINPAAGRLLGYKSSELIGKSFKESIVKEEHAAGARVLERLLAGEKVPPYIRHIRHKSGTVIPVELTPSLVFDENGRPLMIQSIIRDMRDKLSAEENLRKYAERLRIQHTIDLEIIAGRPIKETLTRGLQLLGELLPYKQLSVNIWGKHLKSMIIFAVTAVGEPLNPQGYVYPLDPDFAEKYWPLDETFYIKDLAAFQPKPPMFSHFHACGVHSFLGIPMLVRGLSVGMFTAAAAEPDAFSQEQIEIATEVSTQFALAIQQSRYLAEIQEQTSLLEERVETRTHALRLANAELARATRLKDEFLANMSHELRTPLNAILGKAEVLQEGLYGALNEKQQRAATVIHKSGQQLLSLINDILDIAKIEGDQFELVFDKVSIDSICQSSINLIKQRAQKKQLRLSLENECSITQVVADGRRLKQALVSLLSNAVKFTPAGGEIGLRAHDNGGSLLEFTVWDTGLGIPEADQNRIFEPFVQLGSGLTRAHEGTGLGLSLVQKMVDLHEGEINLRSVEGEGAAFTLALPLLRGEKNGVPESAAVRLARLKTKPNWPIALLFIANDVQKSYSHQEYWQRRGFVTHLESYNFELEPQLAHLKPDFIFLELSDPPKYTLETLARIHGSAAAAGLKTLVVTRRLEPEISARCQEAGADLVLLQPAQPQHLLPLLLQLLGN